MSEQIPTQQEHGNPEDRYAVAVLKSNAVVGHVPREISKICWMFIDRGGSISCTVTGRRQRSILLEGGLEIPCTYTFKAKKKLVNKLITILTEMKYDVLDV